MKSGKASVITRILRTGLLAIATLGGGGLAATGCLDRPVSPSTPNTTNVFVDQIKNTSVDKIDLLFMIDNSISMADKQAFLKDAVPQLVNRLISPAIDPVTNKPEFNPVKNIHIGVITSSIGGHGGDVCAPGSQFNETQNDHAHLVPTVRPSAGLASFNNLGFLWWDPEGDFGGETNAGALISNFQAHVGAAGESGCGYEASLEAWYRFLIDPDPPSDVTSDGQVIVLGATDTVLQQQRADFLRADSLLSIIMLTDENDCSIADVGQNWIAAQASGGNGAFHLPRATTACDTNPNDACCRSCASTGEPPPGCGPVTSDANCTGAGHDDASDHLNLRCWNQRKRFGIDFLYPTRRYVDGLKNQQVPDRTGTLVPNPLYTDFSGEGKTRDPSLVFLATIVGVPWQDIATPESLTDPNALEYMTADEILNAGRWKDLIPDCLNADGATGICNEWNLADQPDDPLMIESTEPRTGTNPVTGLALAPPTGPEFTPAGIPNGHEYNIPAKNDLQYACIFQLAASRDCASLPEGTDCDCEADPDPATLQSPLCQSGASYSTTQKYAKGYPGTRHLEVAKDFGANSIVASICPKVSTGDPGAAAYGYNPAVSAIIERLKEALNAKCINRPVSVKPDGTVQCAIVEVTSAANGCAGCDPNANRQDIDPVLVSPVLKQLGQAGQCGSTNPNGISCTAANFCMCQINPAVDNVDCKTNPNPGGVGWCYIDPLQEPPGTDQSIIDAELALVAECNPKRQIRFIGAETPKSGSTTYIACLGAPVSATGSTDGG
jgi:hypothetical protein